VREFGTNKRNGFLHFKCGRLSNTRTGTTDCRPEKSPIFLNNLKTLQIFQIKWILRDNYDIFFVFNFVQELKKEIL